MGWEDWEFADKTRRREAHDRWLRLWSLEEDVMAGKKDGVVLEVVELATGKVVHTVTVGPGKDADKVTMGMLRNMDLERFSVREQGKD